MHLSLYSNTNSLNIRDWICLHDDDGMPPACFFHLLSAVNSLHIPTNQFSFSTEKPHQNVGRYIALNQITPIQTTSLSTANNLLEQRWIIISQRARHWRIFPCRIQINPKSRLRQMMMSEHWIKVCERRTCCYSQQLMKYNWGNF